MEAINYGSPWPCVKGKVQAAFLMIEFCVSVLKNEANQ